MDSELNVRTEVPSQVAPVKVGSEVVVKVKDEVHLETQNLPAQKRKRYCLEDLETKHAEDVVNLKLLQTCFDLAGAFAAGANMSQSMWFTLHGCKFDSKNLAIGMMIMCPSAEPDIDEKIGENWAMSSNWFLFEVSSIQANKIVLRVLGDMIQEENPVFPTAKTMTVVTPRFVIIPIGLASARGQELLAGQSVKETFRSSSVQGAGESGGMKNGGVVHGGQLLSNPVRSDIDMMMSIRASYWQVGAWCSKDMNKKALWLGMILQYKTNLKIGNVCLRDGINGTDNAIRAGQLNFLVLCPGKALPITIRGGPEMKALLSRPEVTFNMVESVRMVYLLRGIEKPHTIGRTSAIESQILDDLLTWMLHSMVQPHDELLTRYGLETGKRKVVTHKEMREAMKLTEMSW